MKNKIIKLGVCHNDKETYSFDIYRVDGVKEIKSYMERIAWSQSHLSLGNAFLSELIHEEKREEYSNAKRIEVIPLKKVGTRPASLLELGDLVSSIAEETKTNVLLHAKPKNIRGD